MNVEVIQLLDQALAIAADLSQNGPPGWSGQGASIGVLLQRAKGLAGHVPDDSTEQGSDRWPTPAELIEVLNNMPDYTKLSVSVELPSKPKQTWEALLSGWTRVDDSHLVLRGYK